MQLFSHTQSVSATIIRLVALILFLAATLAITSLTILTRSLSDAEAVNVSGSLRMQSYRLAFSISQSMDDIPQKIERFEAALHHPSLARVDNWDIPEDLRHSYRRIVWRWDRLRKTLEAKDHQRYTQEVKAYVDQIDRFVDLLQNYSEQKVAWLTIWQCLGFSLIFGVGYWIVRFVRQDIVKPIRSLTETAQSIQQGQFDLTISNTKANEMGVLARALDKMAQELGTLYNKLELKVAEKTDQLSHAKANLEFLYKAAQQLHQIHFSEQQIKTTLHQLQQHNQLNLVALTPVTGETINIGESLELPQAHIDLRSDHQLLGSLTIEPKPTEPAPLIDSFALLLSQALAHESRLLEQQKLLLAEERGVIARELHDSLAQSLSYLKIQCTLLDRQLSQESESAKSIGQDLQEGLNAAYQQLRQLLSTFRLPLKEGTLNASLKQVIDQLNQQHQCEISFTSQIPPQQLTPNALIHVVQIVREALLNAIKHAKASQISVTCKEQEQELVIEISDNGIGIDHVQSKDNHYGLSIMAERSERINAQLNYLTPPEGGLTVSLSFRPNQ